MKKAEIGTALMIVALVVMSIIGFASSSILSSKKTNLASNSRATYSGCEPDTNKEEVGTPIHKCSKTSLPSNNWNYCVGGSINYVLPDDQHICNQNNYYADNLTRECYTQECCDESTAGDLGYTYNGNTCGKDGNGGQPGDGTTNPAMVAEGPSSSGRDSRCSAYSAGYNNACCVQDTHYCEGKGNIRYRWYGCTGAPCDETIISTQGGPGNLINCPDGVDSSTNPETGKCKDELPTPTSMPAPTSNIGKEGGPCYGPYSNPDPNIKTSSFTCDEGLECTENSSKGTCVEKGETAPAAIIFSAKGEINSTDLTKFKQDFSLLFTIPELNAGSSNQNIPISIQNNGSFNTSTNIDPVLYEKFDKDIFDCKIEITDKSNTKKNEFTSSCENGKITDFGTINVDQYLTTGQEQESPSIPVPTGTCLVKEKVTIQFGNIINSVTFVEDPGQKGCGNNHIAYKDIAGKNIAYRLCNHKGSQYDCMYSCRTEKSEVSCKAVGNEGEATKVYNAQAGFNLEEKAMIRVFNARTTSIYLESLLIEKGTYRSSVDYILYDGNGKKESLTELKPFESISLILTDIASGLSHCIIGKVKGYMFYKLSNNIDDVNSPPLTAIGGPENCFGGTSIWIYIN